MRPGIYLKTTRSGPRTYLQIAEAYRDPTTGKPRQRHIANLGRLDQLVNADLDSLIDGLLKVTGRPGLAATGATVNADTTVFKRALELGDVWAVMQLWQQLGLVQAIARQARGRRFSVDIEKLISVMVVNRLSDPRSKLGLLEWLEAVALPGLDKAEIAHTNLLRAMDFLIEQKDVLEKQLASTLFPLFAEEVELVFYDLTTIRVHGEGEAPGDDLRRFGKPKDRNTPARQFAVGLVQTPEGLPLTHEVLEGNVSEPTTVQGIVTSLTKRFPIKRLIFVADRGMISRDNMESLEAVKRASGAPAESIVAVPARRDREMTRELAGLRPELVAEAKAAGGEAIRELAVDGRRLVVAFSPEIAREARRRAEKLVAAWRLATAMAGTLHEQANGQRRRGRRLTDRGAMLKLRDFLAKKKLTRFIKVDVEGDVFTWVWDVDELKRELALDGLLVLVSNVREMAAVALVARTKALADIERSFRVMKSVLELAPVHHRLPDRIRAHTFICFLALVIQRVMQFRLRKAASELSPETLLYRLKAIQRHQVRLATGQVLVGITTMAAEQRSLFELIGVEPPTRKTAEVGV